jgi:dienelactone hydrolase
VSVVVLFHSSLGLRDVERDAASALRAEGHHVLLPDLYAGRTAEDLEGGLRLMADVGWPAICARAREAVRDAPPGAALVGLSMGAGVVGEVWADRPDASAVVLLHAPARIPDDVRPGTRAEVHAGSEDPFAPADALTDWTATAADRGLDARVHRYPGVGHFFTDPRSTDHDEHASSSAWRRISALLADTASRG